MMVILCSGWVSVTLCAIESATLMNLSRGTLWFGAEPRSASNLRFEMYSSNELIHLVVLAMRIKIICGPSFVS